MSLFNDWTTLLVEVRHLKINTGFVEKIDRHGEPVFKVDSNLSLLGSWESKIQVKSMYDYKNYQSDGIATHILIHGNLTKYMQGHSVFGSSDLSVAPIHAVLKILKFLSIKPNDFELRKIIKGDMEITRMDITHMSRLSNNADVELYLRKYAGTATYRGRLCETVSKNPHIWGTNYIQKNSSRWTFKNYNKFHDLTLGPASHRLPDYVFEKKTLLEFTEGVVRHELTMRKPELRKHNIFTLNDLSAFIAKSQYIQKREKITVADNLTLTDNQILDLPRYLQSTYIMWSNGLDVHSMFNNRMTFLRHRKELLKLGIDINTHVERVNNDNVLPMVRILEAKSIDVPDWAETKGLVFYG